MAHVKKYTKGQVSRLLAHCQRANTNYSNKEIDIERTHLNYALCDRGASYALQYAIEHKALKRDDVKILASWVVTKPEGIKDAEIERFFKETYNFLCNRYGIENNSNVVGAYVHLDETTPHMHFSFVPCVWNEKKKMYKVNAKETINRKDLSTFHKDYNQYMTKVFGRNIGVINGVTKKNQTISELKCHTEMENQLNKRLEDIDIMPSVNIKNPLRYKSEYEKLNNVVNIMDSKNQILEEKNKELQLLVTLANAAQNRNDRSVSRKKLEKLRYLETLEAENSRLKDINRYNHYLINQLKEKNVFLEKQLEEKEKNAIKKEIDKIELEMELD